MSSCTSVSLSVMNHKIPVGAVNASRLLRLSQPVQVENWGLRNVSLQFDSLLKDATNCYHHTLWAAAWQEMILNTFADMMARASFVEFVCKPGDNGLADGLLGRCGMRWMVFDDCKRLNFHKIIST